MSSMGQGDGDASGSRSIKFTTVSGFFLQDEASTDPKDFDYTAVNFGLIKRTYPTDAEYDPEGKKSQWQRFEHYLYSLNKTAEHGTHYKLIFMGRHGYGVHNAAEDRYGTPAWDSYWSLLDGDGTSYWRDAHLTPLGKEQAAAANRFWHHQVKNQLQSLPQSYYASPLWRCLQTAQITYETLYSSMGEGDQGQSFKPVIKELLRETISRHTCDARSDRSVIAAGFTAFPFEHGFPEHDPLWNKDRGETPSEQAARSRTVLGDILRTDKSMILSFTSHSGEIRSLLEELGHRPFSLNTGALIPVLVKVQIFGQDAT